MKILGIDPGTATTGFAVIEKNGLKPITYGTITTRSTEQPSARLLTVFNELKKLIANYSPDEVAVEKVFFTKNVKTAMAVGQSRGVVLLAAAEAGKPVYEYTPNEVKQAIAAYGSASKIQVQEMIKAILKLEEIPRPDDAADALAIAVCHANTNQRLK